MNILLLGANGFIGSHLSDYILAHKPSWKITALDKHENNLAACIGKPNFTLHKGDLRLEREWIEKQVQQCDVVLPLVAIANPALYVENPIAVFELDFEANMHVVRMCVKHQKRIIFPSTSEVYGMSMDTPYDEQTSRLVTGPIHKERWIYSTCKQLMDRVIWAYGARDGLPFTLIRPFNWFGPRQDNVWVRGKANRVVTQFLSNILHGDTITLIDGGGQKRCFLYIDDAIEALCAVIENKNGCADGRIFNIGAPGNELSIKALADALLDTLSAVSGFADIRSKVKIVETKGTEFYGQGYQDIESRIPSIAAAQKHLGWQPRTNMQEALRATVAHCLANRPIT